MFQLLALLLVSQAQAAPSPEEVAIRNDLVRAFEDSFVLARPDAPPLCLTPLVEELKRNWHLLEPEDRSYITGHLAPWKDDLLDPMAGSIDPHLPSPDAPPPPSSCFGQYYPNQLHGEHFVVEWETEHAGQYAQFFLDALEHAWQVEVEEMGWQAPTYSDRYPILALIVDDDSYSGAYATVQQCGSAYVPYMVAYTGGFSYGPWAEDMAAHEFNHTIQFSTSWAPELWWWEATATWVVEHVNPSNNSWSYYLSGFTEQPWMAMNAGSQSDYNIFYHMYGMATLSFYLDEHVGGYEIMRDSWQWASDNMDYWTYAELWMPDAFEGMGYDWEELTLGFMANNTVMDFDDGHLFPDVALQGTFSSFPASGSSHHSTEPESLGSNYIRFRDPGDSADLGLRVKVEGDPVPTWLVGLVAVEDGEVEELVRVTMEDNQGEGEIRFRGDDVYLVVAPMDPSESGYGHSWTQAASWAWSWEAELVDMAEEEEEEGPGDSLDPQDPYGFGDRDGGDSAAPGFDVLTPPCSCASGGAAGFSWVLLSLSGALAARRRRRR